MAWHTLEQRTRQIIAKEQKGYDSRGVDPRQYPVVMQTHPAERASDRFMFVPSYTLVEDMNKLGFTLTQVKQQGKSDFGRHQMVFESEDLTRMMGSLEGLKPNINILNAHDCTGRLIFAFGFIKSICWNGCVFGDVIASFRMRHLGYGFNSLRDTLGEYVGKVPQLAGKIELMRGTKVDDDIKHNLAKTASILRFGEEKHQEMDRVIPNYFRCLLNSMRSEDYNEDLFTAYQVIQENTLRGTQSQFGMWPRISQVSRSMTINQNLWQAAAEYLPKGN